MLTEIRLENFKSFGKKTTIPLAPITVFIGPNGSGKSSPIQALLLLRQSYGQREIVASGDYVDLGKFETLAHKNESPYPTDLSIGISGTEEGKDGYQYKSSFLQDTVFDLSRRIKHKQDTLSMEILGTSGNQQTTINMPSSFSIKGSFSEGDRTPPSQAIQLGPFEFSVRHSDLIGQNFRLQSLPFEQKMETDLLREIFDSGYGTLPEIFFSPASRGISSPLLPLSRSPRGNLTFAREPSTLPSETVTALANRSDLGDRISEWCGKVTGRSLRTTIEYSYQITIEAVQKGMAVNIVNEGFGTNQLVNLFVQLALASEDSIVAIEEPEIHLHPKAQFALADVLREVTVREKKQLIITTHSEHILFRLLSSVAAGDLALQDLAINYFEKKGGITEVTPLEIDEKGRVKGGLPGFFETELNELNTYISALSGKD